MEDLYHSALADRNTSLLGDSQNVTAAPDLDVTYITGPASSSLSPGAGLASPHDNSYDDSVRVFMTKIYAVQIAVLVLLSCARTLLFYQLCIKASKAIHNRMFSTVVRTPMRFFDTNPVGRILNRFSKDIGTVDDQLPVNFYDFFSLGLLVAGTVLMTAVVNPWVLLPLVPIAVILVILYRLYIPTSRAIKRLEGATRSPMFSHLSSTLSGLYTIRALKTQPSFIEEFDKLQDGHTEAFYLFLCVTRWLAIRLDWMCVVYVSTVTFLCIAAKDNLDLSSDLFGLTIVYIMALMGMFQWVVRQSTEIESMMTSVERIAEYMRLQPEAPLTMDVRPPTDWPQSGCIDAEGVSLRYTSDDPFVLKDLRFHINAAEKVGICGRTGAGKSSMLATLFRLCEPSGRVCIDGVCISDIGLHDLRSKISIIPQDPVLFSTSVRGNLDPFSEHADEALWAVLQQVQLAATVQELPGGIDAAIAEGGSNFSVGQRQLLCLARAMLRRNRILVIDEATANVDPKTDATIQETIRNNFSDCTVLTIAHRLNTIMDSDRVMVLDAGSLREFAEPHALLQQPDSLFRGLVKHTRRGFDSLCAAAKAAHDRRKSSAADGL